MRFLLILGVLGLAVLASPLVQMDRSGENTRRAAYVPAQCLVATPQDKGANTCRVGLQALAFFRKPAADTMPVMPDIPAPLRAPQFADDGYQPIKPPLRITEVQPTAARLPRPGNNPFMARIVANGLNLREGPSQRSRSLGALRNGDTVNILGRRRGYWVPVKVASSGQKGWVFYRYLDPPAS